MAPPFPRGVKKVTLGRDAVDSNFTPRVSGAFFLLHIRVSVIMCNVPPGKHFTTYLLFCDVEGRPLFPTRLISEGVVGVLSVGLLAGSLNLQVLPLPVSSDLTLYCKQDTPDKQPGIPSHKNLHLDQTSSAAFGVITPAPYIK